MIMCMSQARFQSAAILIFSLLILWSPADALRSKGHGHRPFVGVVFFSSRNCPLCVNVKELLKNMKVTYPISVKTFDIEREADYLLFERMESIHGRGKFSVPLIMLGETILMGEDEIAGKLERTVQRLAVSGGSPFPYLGPGKVTKRAARRARQESPQTEPEKKVCSTCAKKGRPPSLGEEWSKLKGLIDKYF